MKKIIVVGGVAGGATAAGRLRRLDKESDIIMFERGKFISFANCGLPYYIGGAVKDPTTLLATDAKTFSEFYHIDVRIEQEVLSLDTEKKTVQVYNRVTKEEYTESYDQILLSAGAETIIPKMNGTDLPGVFSLRSYEDALEIREYIDVHRPQKAVVVGGGFIGLEMVEALAAHKMEITLVHKNDSLFSPLDSDMAEMLDTTLEKNKVKLLKNSELMGIKKEGDQLFAMVGTESIQADLILLSIGSRPENKLAKEAGLTILPNGGVQTNSRMETSAPDVYAIGDMVAINHIVTGEPTIMALAGPAQTEARVAASNMTGKLARFKGAVGSKILKIFETTIATTGINSSEATNAGIQFGSVQVSSISHAGYYHGWEEFTMKVLYEEGTGRILGAQIVGGDGVDKRCDVMATAIHGKMTGWDLEDLHLAYAPPYSIPRDAVNIAGNLITTAIEKAQSK